MTVSAALQESTSELGGLLPDLDLGWDRGKISVSPKSTEEVAGVLRFAYERGLAVTPWGGGTKQGWCGTGETAIVLRTNRMSAMLDHQWEDMTCTVQAGLGWGRMQQALRAHRQMVALDPVFEEEATVGGVCGANDSGSLRVRYGGLRDLILGMTVVLADGTIARTGGKVVKNVAGYDLHKLMTGSLGTLGVITEVTFRLHSRPPHRASFTVASREAEPLGRMLLQVMDSHLSVEGMQIRGSGEGYSLDLSLGTLPEVVEAQGASFAAMAGQVGLTAVQGQAEVWGERQTLFEKATGFVVKVTMLPTEIAGFARAVHDLGGSSVTQAVGVMMASVPAGAAEGLKVLRRQVEAKRGSLTVLRQVEGTPVDRWGSEPDTMALMREIKRQFDPRGILNPGRFVGGI